MEQLIESIRSSIASRLPELENEEKRVRSFYEERMNVANNEDKYVPQVRDEARREAECAQEKLDVILNRKLELLKELKEL